MASRWRYRGGLAVAAVSLIGLASASTATAEPALAVHKRVKANRSEVDSIAQRITTPEQIGDPQSKKTIHRKVIEGQVQFGIGNYNDAALILYDVVETYPKHRSYDEALYYLAESLFRKKDDFAARTYFERIATARGTASKYYQNALERLIELSMRTPGDNQIARWLAALDGVPTKGRRPQVPYVRGKYAYFGGDYQTALKYFAEVPAKSRLSRQAAYLAATTKVGMGDLQGALAAFDELRSRKVKGKVQRRIRDLCNLAIGRIHYELDEPSRSIDNYLNVPRRSDLFPDVLYEVAWVYVKNSDYTKALRALELLELTDPKNSKMPEVRILEGNLRIRKAQVLYQRQTGNPLEEYDKASRIFIGTREAFETPRDTLATLIANKIPPEKFVGQLISREPVFESSSARLPEVAIAWLRQQPSVKRLSAVGDNLEHIDREVHSTNKMIRQIEVAITSSARADVFPELAKNRYRLLDIRSETWSDQHALLIALEKGSLSAIKGDARHALARLTKKRLRIVRELRELTGDDKPSKRRKTVRGKYDSVEKLASEVSLVVESTEAEITGLQVYARGAEDLPKNMPEVRTRLAELRQRLLEMRSILAELREDIVVGRGAAGEGLALREEHLRRQLAGIVEREVTFFRAKIPGLPGPSRATLSATLAALIDARALELQADRTLANLNSAADAALAEARGILEQEHSRLVGYSTELDGQALESRAIGRDVISKALPRVKDQFDDIVMQSEIGTIDVVWAHKESNEKLAKKLVLDRARERKMLDFEFRNVIEELEAEEKRLEQKESSE